MIRTDRTIATLTAQLENAARRVALMSNAALSFREVIRRFGDHLPECDLTTQYLSDEPRPAPTCSCGWDRVEAFMSDDSNFGEVQQIQTIAVQDSKVILAR